MLYRITYVKNHFKLQSILFGGVVVRKQLEMQLTILNIWWHFWTDRSHIYFTCVMLSRRFIMQLGRNMMILITLIRHQQVR